MRKLDVKEVASFQFNAGMEIKEPEGVLAGILRSLTMVIRKLRLMLAKLGFSE